MTFSCIKIKRKFKMKFSVPNYSVEAANPADIECDESTDVVNDNLKDTSRAYAFSKSSTTTASATSDSSCVLDTSTSAQTSSSLNVTTNESFNTTDKSLDLIQTEADISKESTHRTKDNGDKKSSSDKILKSQKNKKNNSRFQSPSRNFKSSSLPPPPPPPPPPPYVPSLDSMPSLPNTSISNSFAAFDTATSQSAHFISHVFSTNSAAPNITNSSVSNSSSSGKISDGSSKHNNLVSRLISNRIDKFKLISRNRHSEPNQSPNPVKSPRIHSPSIPQQHQIKLYDRINLKSKLKEHLYSPLHFESESRVLNFQQTQEKGKKNQLNYPRDDFRGKVLETISDRRSQPPHKRHSNSSNGTDQIRSKQLYFKSNMTTTSTYDECNYAKSINTNDSADDTENQKINDTDYDERECCSKNCNYIITEDDYYDYDETENNPYEEHDYNDYNYNEENFENEYDDVDYEPSQSREANKRSLSKNSSKKSPGIKKLNQIVVSSLEDALKATDEILHSDKQTEYDESSKTELLELTQLINKELHLTKNELEESSLEPDTQTEVQSNKSILNDVDGYIRLTEDEINDIINTIEPIKNNESVVLNKENETTNKIQEDNHLDNSITLSGIG